jgi:hypothetical protein
MGIRNLFSVSMTLSIHPLGFPILSHLLTECGEVDPQLKWVVHLSQDCLARKAEVPQRALALERLIHAVTLATQKAKYNPFVSPAYRIDFDRNAGD